MKIIDRNLATGFLAGVVLAGVPSWYVVDSINRVSNAVEKCNKNAEEIHRQLIELKRDIGDLRKSK